MGRLFILAFCLISFISGQTVSACPRCPGHKPEPKEQDSIN